MTDPNPFETDGPMKPIPTGLAPRGALKQPAGCLLFDVYGTLFISTSGDIGLMQAQVAGSGLLDPLLEFYHIEEDAEHLMARLTAEIEAEHARRKAAGVAVPEVRIEQVWRRLLKDVPGGAIRRFAEDFEHTVNPVFPMPHLETMLSACRTASLPMGIISNAQFYTPRLFKRHLGADLVALGFDPELTFFSFRFGRAKPGRWMFEQAKERLAQRAVAAGRTLYVGNDMLNDICPAAATGFKTALFAGDRRSLNLRQGHPECRGLKPDLVITDLRQLLEVVPV